MGTLLLNQHKSNFIRLRKLTKGTDLTHFTFFQLNESVTSTGKERDEETGYSYFGARYYDSDLSGLFLSVNPMADMYTGYSPYQYCRWNPVRRIDVYGLFDTEKSAQKAHEKAVNHFGEDRVGEIFNRGSKEKPDYAFHVYGAGKDNKTHEAPTGVWAYRPSETISSKWGLIKYKYLGAERDNELSMTLSLGFQGRVNIGSWGVNFNLSSVDLAGLNVDLDKGMISGHCVQENNAKASSGIGLGIGIFKVGYECNYSGGDYIDRNSVSHSVKGNVLGAGIGSSLGNIELGIGASLIFGVDLKLTSTIRK